MTQVIFNRIGAYLGWCPNSHAISAKIPLHGSGTGQPGFSDPEPPQPGTTPASLVTPHWMDAVAVVILLATPTVGGNIWWLAIVFAVLVLFVILRIRTLQTQQIT
ncbi:MAG: hypothetical protein M0Q92_03815 [Methanoregula sp.]|jgi:hypothetical protein|nr:hypothetical protein [Methanoregula sp.]